MPTILSRRFGTLAIALFVVCTAAVSPAFSQRNRRVNYTDLAFRNREAAIHFDHLVIPAAEDGKSTLLIHFRIEYDYLTFVKDGNGVPDENSSSGYTFNAEAKFNLEVIRAGQGRPGPDRGPKEKDKNAGIGTGNVTATQGSTDKLKDENEEKASVPGITRSFWTGSVQTDDYDDTQSDRLFLEGYISADLEPGAYEYVLQYRDSNRSGEESSRRRRILINDFSQDQRMKVGLTRQLTDDAASKGFKLLNFGKNVYYGRDFGAVVMIPDYSEGKKYDLVVSSVESDTRKDTTIKEEVINVTIPKESIFSGYSLVPNSDSIGTPTFKLTANSESPFTYALVKIENSKLENDFFKMEVIDDAASKTIGSSIYQSRWVDIPTSLLNLDVSLDMLQYIVKKKELKDMKRGSDEDKLAVFNKFWKEKDPTPSTDYNELMAEYYRRIDYAFRKFNTLQNRGFNTDQGRTYIKYGPPVSVSRQFPPNQPSLEIWKYGNVEFIFQATTGFGDYQLVKTRPIAG